MSFVRLLYFVVALGLVCVFAEAVRAQDDPNFETGLKPYGIYHAGNIDAVSLSNLGLNLNIPLVSYPQRGGKLKLDFVLQYQNSSLYADYVCIDEFGDYFCYWQPGGMASGFSLIDKEELQPQLTGVVSDSYTVIEYAAVEANGATHSMWPTSHTSLESIDASGYQGTITGGGGLSGSLSALIDPDGLRWNYPNLPCPSTAGEFVGFFGSGLSNFPNLCDSTREDSNGNQIVFSNSTGWTDTMGRNIPLPVYSMSSSDFTGCVGTVDSVYKWSPPGVNGGTYPIKFCINSINGYEVTSVVLPNGTVWSMQWTTNLYGSDFDPSLSYITEDSVSQIKFPTGGSLSYSWAGSAVCPTHTGVENSAVISRALDPNDGVDPIGTSHYTYTIPSGTYENTVLTDPLGNDSVHTFGLTVGGNPSACYSYETKAQYYQGTHTSGTLLKEIDTAYSYTVATTLPANGYASQLLNTVPTAMTTIWGNGQQSQIKHAYDSSNFTFYFTDGGGTPFHFADDSSRGTAIFGREITKQEYDYGTGSPGSLLRTTSTAYMFQTSSNYKTNNLLNLPSSVKITDGGGTQRAYTTYTYDGASLVASGISTEHDSSPPDGTYRGNLTSTAHWLNTTGGYLTNTRSDYDTGMLSVATDPNSKATTYTYDSTGTLITQIQHPTTPTSVSHIESFTYDANTGLMLTHVDQNGQTTSYGPYDSMGRLTGITLPSGGGAVSYSYNDSTSSPGYTYTRSITSSVNSVETAVVDGVGRLIQTQTAVPSTTCPGGYVYIDTRYDALGRKAADSNPDCTAITTDDVLTSYAYDPLGRPTTVTSQDNGTVATSYTGACSTTTDQAGKARQNCTDGLGRLTGVWEDPLGLNYPTVYTYDALDDLASVSQDSSRSRTFTYDSLSRLTIASNPESGSTCYGTLSGSTCQQNGYDGDGNLLTQTDARGDVITYCYDALNRLTAKGYGSQTCSNGWLSTPVATYVYDAQSPPSGCSVGSFSYGNYPKPHRTALCDAAGSEAWNYNTVGYVLDDQRTTNGLAKTTAYAPNYDGSTYQLTYPSGRTITYAPNSGEPPVSAIDTVNSINYATSAIYTPQHTLTSLNNGSNLITTTLYNSRLQPCRIAVNSSGSAPNSCASSNTGNVLDLSYNFNLGSSDNGNVAGIANNIDATRSQTFTYDTLNRIASGETTSTYSTSPTHCWGESYVYDSTSGPHAWGNLVQINPASSAYTGCTQESLGIAVNSNNHITTTGFGYDAAGNMTSGPSSYSYTYNAENQLTQAAVYSTDSYVYDGDGKRIEKTASGSVTKIYWYGNEGEILDETDGGGSTSNSSFNEYMFFNDKRIARRDYSGNVFYYFADELGTAREIVQSGSTTPCYDADFYPFGGERPYTTTCSQNYKFTGKERDSESNLDNFGARYDSSSVGRFMSPDPKRVGTHLFDPQTFNRYAYARNNPLLYVDPDGQDVKAFWQDIKQAISQVSVKATLGLVAGMTVTKGGSQAQAEAAGKFTLTFHDGKTSLSLTGEAEASVKTPGAPKTGLGMEGDAVLASYDMKMKSFGGTETPTWDGTIGTKNYGATAAGSDQGSLTYGTEAGEVVGGGGSVSMPPAALQLLLQAPIDLFRPSTSTTSTPPTPSQQAQPPQPPVGCSAHVDSSRPWQVNSPGAQKMYTGCE